MGKFDLKMLKTWLYDVLREIIEDILERENEQWLDEEHFLQEFQMFTKDWLKHNRGKLPCRKPEGCKHWAYARHETNRLIRTGML